jgi:hypothetical protein
MNTADHKQWYPEEDHGLQKPAESPDRLYLRLKKSPWYQMPRIGSEKIGGPGSHDAVRNFFPATGNPFWAGGYRTGPSSPDPRSL